jgi:hypothetical protein
MISAAKKLHGISGPLLFLGLVTTLAHAFLPAFPSWPGTVMLWSAGLILFFFLDSPQRKVVIILGLLAFLAWLFAWHSGHSDQFKDAFSINQPVVVLLIGVNFLQLVATPQTSLGEELPSGKSAFIKTYLGVLLFGSVINLSAVMLVGDRLVKKAALTGNQQKLLTRAFSSAANWSPFFAAFGAASVFAPEAMLSIVIPSGFLLAIIAFLWTLREVTSSPSVPINQFFGYPMHYSVLWLPTVLCLLVFIAHALFPSIKIILLIALLSTLTSIFVLALRRGARPGIAELQNYIVQRLPKMRGELLLFLVAGLFGSGLAATIDGMAIAFPFATFDGVAAAQILLIMVILALVGVHPVISIAVIGHWVATLEPNQTLLAMTFLMAWAISIALSPFSGLALALHGRYGLSGVEMFKANLPHAVVMYGASCLVLLVVGDYLGA